MAAQVQAAGGSEFPLTHVAGTPMTLQTYLNTFRPQVSAVRGAMLLRGVEAAFVAVAMPRPSRERDRRMIPRGTRCSRPARMGRRDRDNPGESSQPEPR